MLTHENVMASVSAVLMQMGDHSPRRTDVLISFLPLAHMLERCCEVISTILHLVIRHDLIQFNSY